MDVAGEAPKVAAAEVARAAITTIVITTTRSTVRPMGKPPRATHPKSPVDAEVAVVADPAASVSASGLSFQSPSAKHCVTRFARLDSLRPIRAYPTRTVVVPVVAA